MGFNGNGELGDGTETDRAVPGSVCAVRATDCTATPLTGITTLAVCGQVTLARTSEATMLAWGANFDGMLGNGTTTDSLAPAAVLSSPLTGVAAIAAGRRHRLAIRAGS